MSIARSLFVVVLCLPLIGGCGAKESGPVNVSTIASLPATLDGDFSIDVINDAGRFGTLSVGQARYLVAVPASVFAASGVSNSGGKVRMTVDSKEEFVPGVPTYKASALKRL
jgi:hypothetical protein